MNKHEVVIDGALYVPATQVGPTVDTIMQALWEEYMGSGRRWNDGKNASTLFTGLNEDGEGDSLEELAARIAQMAKGAPQ